MSLVVTCLSLSEDRANFGDKITNSFKNNRIEVECVMLFVVTSNYRRNLEVAGGKSESTFRRRIAASKCLKYIRM
jgi:hypothetical protein